MHVYNWKCHKPQMHACIQLQILCVMENEEAVEARQARLKWWAMIQWLKYGADTALLLVQ
jgi:hypothetical protein